MAEEQKINIPEAEQNSSSKQNTPENTIQELTELVQRTQSNFENYRKQTEKRVADLKQFAGKEIIVQLLPLADNFELAFKSLDLEKLPKEFIAGIKLIYGQLMTVLENNGVQPLLTEKQQYNPHYHEALMKVESALPENTIIEEFQRGFTLHGQVLRHAKVKISAGKKPAEQEKKNEKTKK